MTDIVERLRELEQVEHELAHDCDYPPEATANWKYAETCREAAAEIERLRKDLSLAVFADNEYWQVLEKENERLRAALERIAFGKYHWEADAQEEARAALETREAGVSSEVKND